MAPAGAFVKPNSAALFADSAAGFVASEFGSPAVVVDLAAAGSGLLSKPAGAASSALASAAEWGKLAEPISKSKLEKFKISEKDVEK